MRIGDTVVINTNKYDLLGTKGKITKIEDNNVWAIWEDTKREQFVPIEDVELFGRFKIGDVVKIGNETINITEENFNMKDETAILVSRKNLI